MTHEDKHLDTPELGDWIEFTGMADYGYEVQGRGEILKVYPRARSVDVLADNGRRFKRIPFDKFTVLSKAA